MNDAYTLIAKTHVTLKQLQRGKHPKPVVKLQKKLKGVISYDSACSTMMGFLNQHEKRK